MRRLHNHKGTAQISLLKASGAVAALLAASLVSRWYGAGALANYGVMSTWVALGSVLIGFGAPVYLLSSMKSGALRVVDAGARWSSLVVLLLMSLAVVPFVWARASHLLPGLSAFFATWLVAGGLLLTASSIWVSQRRFLLNAMVVDTLRPSIPAVAMLAGWLLSRGAIPQTSSVGLCGAVCFGILAATGAWVIAGPVAGHGVGRIRAGELRRGTAELLRVGAATVPSGVLMILVAQVDRLYLIKIQSPQSVGVYVAGQTVVGVVTYFLSAVAVQRLPALIESMSVRDRRRVRAISRGVSRQSMAVGTAALLAALPAAPVLGAWFHLPGRQVAAVAAVLITGNVASQVFGVGVTIMTYDDSNSRLWLLLFLSVSIAASVAVGSSLTHVMGVLGAAIGSALGMVLQRLLPYLYYRRRGVSLLAIGRST